MGFSPRATLAACCMVEVVKGGGGLRFASPSLNDLTTTVPTSATAAANALSMKYGLSSVTKSGFVSHSADHSPSVFASAKNSMAPK